MVVGLKVQVFSIFEGLVEMAGNGIFVVIVQP